MGNSLGVVLDNYIGTAPFPCYLQLGETTSIVLSRFFEKDDDGGVMEVFNVVYKVDKDIYQVGFIKASNPETVYFRIRDVVSMLNCAEYSMVITKTKYITIYPRSWLPSSIISRKKSFDASGGVVHTRVHSYGEGSMWGLVVLESKKNPSDEVAEVVTLAHYFVKSSGRSSDRSTGTDIGLSVVAKCGVSNGKFDVTMEGLEQHPVSALLYMFDEVKRTGIWKPTMCPHCDHKRRGKVFWQSDSEDSDSISIPVPRATPKNARGVSNGGRFKGNGNGNIYENNVIIVRKKR